MELLLTYHDRVDSVHAKIQLHVLAHVQQYHPIKMKLLINFYIKLFKIFKLIKIFTTHTFATIANRSILHATNSTNA